MFCCIIRLMRRAGRRMFIIWMVDFLRQATLRSRPSDDQYNTFWIGWTGMVQMTVHADELIPKTICASQSYRLEQQLLPTVAYKARASLVHTKCSLDAQCVYWSAQYISTNRCKDPSHEDIQLLRLCEEGRCMSRVANGGFPTMVKSSPMQAQYSTNSRCQKNKFQNRMYIYQVPDT